MTQETRVECKIAGFRCPDCEMPISVIWTSPLTMFGTAHVVHPNDDGGHGAKFEREIDLSAIEQADRIARGGRNVPVDVYAKILPRAKPAHS